MQENIMIHATYTHSGIKSDLDAPKAKEYLTKAAGEKLDESSVNQLKRIY